MITSYVIQRLTQTEDSNNLKWIDASHFFIDKDRAFDAYVKAVERFPKYKMQLIERVMTERVIFDEQVGKALSHRQSTESSGEDF